MMRGGILMKAKHILNHIVIHTLVAYTIFLFASCAKEESFSEMDLENRESILDRVVYIERELIMDIPFIERWCDRLELKKQRIDVGDAKLYVEEEGKGMPLVLINGGPGGTHHYFHPWFSKAKKYARVIYYDQRGCGLSDFEPGEEGYSVHQAVEDLDAIRKALVIDKPILELLGIDENTRLEISTDGKSLLITPIRKKITSKKNLPQIQIS